MRTKGNSKGAELHSLIGALLWIGTAWGTAVQGGVPVIQQQPQSQRVVVGSDVTFNVTAEGTAPLEYLWYRDGTNLVASGPDPTLELTAVTLADAGSYHVVVRNVEGEARSLPADLEVLEPEDYQRVGAWPGPRDINHLHVHKVTLRGNYAYLAADRAGIIILDVTQPRLARSVGFYETEAAALDLVAEDNQIYVAAGDKGLLVLDVQDPVNPILLGQAQTGGRARAVSVAGTYAYVAADTNGLEVFDVGNPSNIVRVAVVQTGAAARAVAVGSSAVFVATGDTGLQIFDVGDPTAPQLVANVPTIGSSDSVRVFGNSAYLVESDRVHILDVTDPAHPVKIDQVTVAGAQGSINDVLVEGTVVYVGTGESGEDRGHVLSWDLSDPSQPQERISQSVLTEGSVEGLALGENGLFVALGQRGMGFVDLSATPSAMYFASYETVFGEQDWMAAKAHHYLLVAAGTGRLKVLDIAEPNRPFVVNRFDVGGALRCVITKDDVAYVGSAVSGNEGGKVTVLDISDPAHPTAIASFGREIEDPRGIALHGDWLYIADFDNGLVAVNQVLGESSTTVADRTIQRAVDVELAEEPGSGRVLAFVAASDNGFAVFDVTTPSAPLRLHQVSESRAEALVASLPYLYVAAGSSGLKVYELDGNAKPRLVSTAGETLGSVHSLAVAEHKAFVGVNGKGLRVFDVGDPTKPIEIGGFSDVVTPQRLLVIDPYVVVSSRSWWGTLILRKQSVACTSPQLIDAPESMDVRLGEKATLEIRVQGDGPFRYQWYHNGRPIPGANSAQLIIPQVVFPDEGAYFAVITNICGRLQSPTAQLEVILPFGVPKVFVNDMWVKTTAVTVTNEARVRIVESFPDQTVFYTLDDSEPVPNRFYSQPFVVDRTATLRVAGYSPDLQTMYNARPVEITVLAPPVVTTLQPEIHAVPLGTRVELQPEVQGSEPLAYQWSLDGVELPGETGPTLVLPSVQVDQAGHYEVRVSNSVGVTQASFDVIVLPFLETALTASTAMVNEPFMLCVQAAGSGPLTYQWRQNGQDLEGQTNACLEIPRVSLTDGGSYEVVVANAWGAVVSEPVELIIDVPSQGQPADNFDERLAITGTNGFVKGTVQGATREEPDEPWHAGKYGTNSVWCEWEAPASGIAEFETTGSTFDTLLAVYQGGSLDGLREVARDDDGSTLLTSKARFNVVAGERYQIAVDRHGLSGPMGYFILGWTMEVTTNLLPVITRQPESQTVAQGSSVTLTVEVSATGQTSLSYQWLFFGELIAGADQPILELDDVQPTDVGDYQVRIRDESGLELFSEVATVEIGPNPDVQSFDKLVDALHPPSVLGQPQGQPLPGGAAPAPPGSVVPVAPVVRFGSPITHFANNRRSGTDIGETAGCGEAGGKSRYFILAVGDDGELVIDTKGSGFDTFVRVSKFPRPTETLACNDDADEGVTWSRVILPAQKDELFMISVASKPGEPQNAGLFQLNALLGKMPTATASNMVNVALRRGQSIQFDLGPVEGEPLPMIQWWRDGTPLQGETNATLRLASVGLEDAGLYRVVLSNDWQLISLMIADVEVDPALILQSGSTFDQGNEGWVVRSAGSYQDYFSPTNGSRGGFYAVTNRRTGDLSWVAPAQFLGDRRDLYGGWLEFDLWQSEATQASGQAPRVYLEGAGEIVTLLLTNAPIPRTGWVQYRVVLADPFALRVDGAVRPATGPEVLQVLSDLTDLRITQPDLPPGLSGLDNVNLVQVCKPCSRDVPPQIRLRHFEGDTWLLEWPSSAACYELQAATDLTQPEWTSDPRVVQADFIGCPNRALIQLGEGNLFFRLYKAP